MKANKRIINAEWDVGIWRTSKYRQNEKQHRTRSKSRKNLLGEKKKLHFNTFFLFIRCSLFELSKWKKRNKKGDNDDNDSDEKKKEQREIIPIYEYLGETNDATCECHVSPISPTSFFSSRCLCVFLCSVFLHFGVSRIN